MKYYDCKILCKLEKKEEPIITKVNVDKNIENISKAFDYVFDGESKIYPYKLPEILENEEFKICCVVGASGSGKSTLLKEFKNYKSNFKQFNENAIISNFNSVENGKERLMSVGLNNIPVWCRPRKVLSIGEGFRADLALNLDSYMIFDEFTSTIDRNVAKTTCKGIKNYIDKHFLHNIVFCSCHKDFISFLQPDIVIDLDEEKVFDCRGECLGEQFSYIYIEQEKSINNKYGEYLKTIII